MSGTLSAISVLTPNFEHPEVTYWKHEWQMLRDCVAGEMEIKRNGEKYLPKLDQMTKEEYKAFLYRSVFFNMVNRTVTGLVGKLFRRPPMLENMPEKLQAKTEQITKDNQSLTIFVKGVAEEVFTTGRYGVLLDMDPAGINSPYFAGYVAENIVNWNTEIINGREILSEVVLREIRYVRNIPLSPEVKGSKTSKNKPTTIPVNNGVSTNKYLAAYRVLRLEDTPNGRVYKQYYYESSNSNADINGIPTSVTIPTNRGVPFDFIPFVFFGPKSNGYEVEKPPIQDIARINLSHYNSYAQLEHGRFYTGLPIYWVKGTTGAEVPEYVLGPSTVWVLPADGQANVIEFNGQGLKFLENALREKEMQAATLGGRLMGVTMESTAESDNALKIKESNEHALLLNVAESLDQGITILLRWWAEWQDIAKEIASKINYKVSKSFIFDASGAREFRAIHAMYKDEIIPIQVVYDYLKKAEVIPDWMKIEEFTRLLESEEGFPNNPDFKAKKKGFSDNSEEVDVKEAEKDRKLEKELANLRGFRSQSD